MIIEEYNEKDFLLKDSIDSAAMYHAKLFKRGEYIFRIHDCITGIRLRGELRTEQDFDDAIRKFDNLSDALIRFQFHLQELKRKNFKKHEQSEAIHH